VASPKIYYLPGRGGSIKEGLGKNLFERGYEVWGRETRGDFAGLEFADQVEIIAQDLKKYFFDDKSKVIANFCYSRRFLENLALIHTH